MLPLPIRHLYFIASLTVLLINSNTTLKPELLRPYSSTLAALLQLGFVHMPQYWLQTLLLVFTSFPHFYCVWIIHSANPTHSHSWKLYLCCDLKTLKCGHILFWVKGQNCVLSPKGRVKTCSSPRGSGRSALHFYTPDICQSWNIFSSDISECIHTEKMIIGKMWSDKSFTICSFSVGSKHGNLSKTPGTCTQSLHPTVPLILYSPANLFDFSLNSQIHLFYLNFPMVEKQTLQSH